jgi:hypothetical protein
MSTTWLWLLGAAGILYLVKVAIVMIPRLKVAALKRSRTMSYVWFSLCLVIISAIAWKGIRLSYDIFLNEDTFTIIAPFTIAGNTDKADTEGLALALALQAKLKTITAELDNVLSVLAAQTQAVTAKETTPQLADAGSETSRATAQVSATSTPLSLPQGVLQPLNIEAKIAGIEVGGIISWIYQRAADRGALKFAVTKAEGKATVAGQLNRAGTVFISETVSASSDSIISAVAYSIFHDHLRQKVPEVNALAWADVEILFTTIITISRLKVQTEAGGLPVEQYKQQLKDLQLVLAKVPQWRALLRICAEAARQARELKLATFYLRRVLSMTDKTSESELYQTILADLEKVRDNFGLEYADALNAPDSNPISIFNEALSAHMKLLEVDVPPTTSHPIVAIIGSTPFRDAVGYEFEVINDRNLAADPHLGAYVDTLGLIIKTLAPASKIVFVEARRDDQRDTLSTVDIADTIEDVLKIGARIMVLPFISTVPSQIFPILFNRVASLGCLAFLPAGGNPDAGLPFGINPANALVAIVAATDIGGRRTLFSPNKDILWAPGTQIPTLQGTGVWNISRSAGFAAATAVGVAANVLAAGRSLSPSELLDLLRKSSRVIDPRDGGIGILSQKAALAALAQGRGEP